MSGFFVLNPKITIFDNSSTDKMKEKTSALYSPYVIDGTAMELTPAQILGLDVPEEKFDSVIDETLDPGVASFTYDEDRIGEYLQAVLKCSENPFQNEYAVSRTKGALETSLIDAIWRDGHFRFGDLKVDAKWKWNDLKTGSMAAFYQSVQAAGDLLEALGIGFGELEVEAGVKSLVRKTNSLQFKVTLASGENVISEEFQSEIPFRTANPEFSTKDKQAHNALPDEKSWLIFIPFDSCDFRLGGSTLCRAMNTPGGTAPEIGDADYFIDCYELVREFVEDDIILGGITVGEGGLITALRKFLGRSTGASIQLNEIMKSYKEQNAGRILFAEIPGVIIQIRDIDYDYVDAEILLQDIVYFPIGHPNTSDNIISVKSSGKSGIETILESLIRSQSSEGED